MQPTQLLPQVQEVLNETQTGFITLIKTPPSSFWSKLFASTCTYEYVLKNNNNEMINRQPITREQYDSCYKLLYQQVVTKQLLSKSEHHIVKSIHLTLPFPVRKLKKCMLMLNESDCIDLLDSHVFHVLGLLEQTSFKIPFLDSVPIPNFITQMQNIYLHLEFYEQQDNLDLITYQVESEQHDSTFVKNMLQPQFGPFSYNIHHPFDLQIANKFLCCEPQVCDELDHVFKLQRSNVHTIYVSLQDKYTHEIVDASTNIKDLVVFDQDHKILHVYQETMPITTIQIKIPFDHQHKHLVVSIRCKQSNLQLQICVLGTYKTKIRSYSGQLVELID